MTLSYGGAGELTIEDPEGGGTRLELRFPREVAGGSPGGREDR